MIFGGLEVEAYDRSYGDGQLVARIVRYFGPAKRLMLIVALLVVCSALLDAAVPLAVARGVNDLATSRAATSVGLLVGIILLAGALSWGCNFVQQWFTARSGGDVVLRLRGGAVGAVLGGGLLLCGGV